MSLGRTKGNADMANLRLQNRNSFSDVWILHADLLREVSVCSGTMK